MVCFKYSGVNQKQKVKKSRTNFFSNMKNRLEHDAHKRNATPQFTLPFRLFLHHTTSSLGHQTIKLPQQ